MAKQLKNNTRVTDNDRRQTDRRHIGNSRILQCKLQKVLFTIGCLAPSAAGQNNCLLWVIPYLMWYFCAVAWGYFFGPKYNARWWKIIGIRLKLIFFQNPALKAGATDHSSVHPSQRESVSLLEPKWEQLRSIGISTGDRRPVCKAKQRRKKGPGFRASMPLIYMRIINQVQKYIICM